MGRAVSTVLFPRTTGSLRPSVPRQQYNPSIISTTKPSPRFQLDLWLISLFIVLAGVLCLDSFWWLPFMALWFYFYSLEARHSGVIFHWYLVVTPYENSHLGSPTDRYWGVNKSVGGESSVRTLQLRVTGGENGVFPFSGYSWFSVCVGNEIITQ